MGSVTAIRLGRREAIAKAILSFRDLQDKLGISRTEQPEFFWEWQGRISHKPDTHFKPDRLSSQLSYSP